MIGAYGQVIGDSAPTFKTTGAEGTIASVTTLMVKLLELLVWWLGYRTSSIGNSGGWAANFGGLCLKDFICEIFYFEASGVLN